MPHLLQFSDNDLEILVGPDHLGGIQAVGRADGDTIQKIDRALEDSLKVVGVIAGALREVISRAGLSSAEAELGFRFNGKGSIYIVQAETQASLRIKLRLKSTSK